MSRAAGGRPSRGVPATYVRYKSGREEVLHHKSEAERKAAWELLSKLSTVDTYRPYSRGDRR